MAAAGKFRSHQRPIQFWTGIQQSSMTVLLPVLHCVDFCFADNNCALQNCAFGESRNRSGQKAVKGKRKRSEVGQECVQERRKRRRNLSFLIAHAASFQKGGRVFSSSSRYKSLGSDRVGTGEWGWMKKNRVKFLLELLDMSWHITGTTSLKCHIYPFAVITQIKRM